MANIYRNTGFIIDVGGGGNFSSDVERELNARYFDDRILNFDYLASYPLPNTMTAIRDSFSRGFRGMKADMRTTADNAVVLCHDPGFTFDADGRIIKYNSTNYTPISSLALSEIELLEFARLKDDGTREHPCTLERFIRFCKANGVIPYITARHNDVSVAKASYDILTKYDMRYTSIFNIYHLRPSIGNALNRKDDKLLLCYTIDGADTQITMDIIQNAITYKCKYICLWNYNQVQQLTEDIRDTLISYGVRLMCLTTESEPMLRLIENGVIGFQNYLHRTEVETLEF